MSSKKEQNKRYYLKHREEKIAYSKKYWEEKAKAYKIPDLEGEEWRPLVGYEEHYMASNMGRIKSTWRMKERIIGGCFDQEGYIKMTLTNPDRSQSTYRRARLIALTWIPNPENKPEIDHINTDRTDDRVENLRWVTSSENQNNPLTLQHMSEWQKGKTKAEVRRVSKATGIAINQTPYGAQNDEGWQSKARTDMDGWVNHLKTHKVKQTTVTLAMDTLFFYRKKKLLTADEYKGYKR